MRRRFADALRKKLDEFKGLPTKRERFYAVFVTIVMNEWLSSMHSMADLTTRNLIYRIWRIAKETSMNISDWTRSGSLLLPSRAGRAIAAFLGAPFNHAQFAMWNTSEPRLFFSKSLF